MSRRVYALSSPPFLFTLPPSFLCFCYYCNPSQAKRGWDITKPDPNRHPSPFPLYDPFNTTYSLTLTSGFISLLHLFSRYIVHTTSYHVHIRSSLFVFLPQPSSLHPEHTYSSPSQRRFSQNNRLPVLLLWDYGFLRIINPRPF